MPVIEVVGGLEDDETPEVDEETTGEIDQESAQVDAETEGETTETETEDDYSFADSAPQEEEVKEQDSWVLKDLRKRYEEEKRARKVLEDELKKAAPAKPKIEQKPTLESCEFDAEVFEQKLASWYEQRREAEKQEAEAEKALEAQRREFEEKKSKYEAGKKAFPLPGIDEAEEAVKAFLDETQQSILLHVTDKPEKLVYALYKNPSKLKELAQVKDPLKLAIKINEMEKAIVATKKSIPAPEKVLRASATPGASNLEKQLDKLRETAMKTGDVSKVAAFRRQHNL